MRAWNDRGPAKPAPGVTLTEAEAWRVLIRLVAEKGIPAGVAVSEISTARVSGAMTAQVAKALEVVRAEKNP